MEKHALIIAGALIVGYAIATALKNNEIRNTDCDTLKQKYMDKNNSLLIILAIAGVIIVLVGVYS